MENSTTLREWFARVDSAHTGNVTAPRLKVLLRRTKSALAFVCPSCIIYAYKATTNRGYLVPDDVHEALVKINFLPDTPAFYTVCEVVSYDEAFIYSNIIPQKRNVKALFKA